MEIQIVTGYYRQRINLNGPKLWLGVVSKETKAENVQSKNYSITVEVLNSKGKVTIDLKAKMRKRLDDIKIEALANEKRQPYKTNKIYTLSQLVNVTGHVTSISLENAKTIDPDGVI